MPTDKDREFLSAYRREASHVSGSAQHVLLVKPSTIFRAFGSRTTY